MLSDEEKDRLKAIFRGVWLSPTEFLEELKRHVGQQNLRIQLKGPGQKNHSGSITKIMNDIVEISYMNDGNVEVNISKIAGFTTPTDWYRQRKS